MNSDLRTLRFEEYDWYDIMEDQEKHRVVGITNIGSWYCDIPAESASKIREGTAAFREYVVGALQSGLEPGEVQIG